MLVRMLIGLLAGLAVMVPPAGAAERDKLLADPGVYVTFTVFQLDDAWWKLDAAAKQSAAGSLRDVVQRHAEHVAVDAYLSRGLADRADFFLRLHAMELAHNQAVLLDLMATPLGPYLKMIGTFNGITKKVNYVPSMPDEMKAALKATPDAGPKPYALMVPIRKDAAWWGLDREARQKQIQEHTQASLPYLKTVKRKLYHSSGLDDFDFLTYFETAKLDDFHNLILSLQQIEEYRHITRLGHPILLGTVTTPEELARALAR
jgi:chlorite dismutase